jgi:intraflagellar transport protein 20
METSGLSDRLSHYGIHVDDLSRLRVLDENSGTHSHDLRDNCREFVGDVSSLTDIADGFIEVIDAVANEVNKEKVKVIGARNRLQTIAKERETQMTQLTALIREKQLERERLANQYSSLVRVQNEQNDFIEQYLRK